VKEIEAVQTENFFDWLNLFKKELFLAINIIILFYNLIKLIN